MAATNLKETTDSFDGDSKENQGQAQQNASTNNGAIDAKTGGQVNGGVVAQSGNRMQTENQDGPEPV